MSTQRKRSATSPLIQPPQLPKHPSPAASPPERLTDHASFTQQTLLDCDFADQAADDIVFDQVVCKRVNLSQAQIPLAQIRDARFDVCDLAGSAWEKAHLRRVELIGCRIVGIKLLDASLADVLIQQCNGTLARFWSSTFKAVRFDHCLLREASFEGSDLCDAIFRGCDLTNADLRGAKLHGADFRGSTIAGMQVGAKELQGAIIAPAQAVHLAGLLGIVVKPEDDP